MSFYVIMGTHVFNGHKYIELMLPETTRHFWSSDFQMISERAWYIQGELLGTMVGEC
jgi:hypothetical protein